MATGGIEFPKIHPLGRPMKRANTVNAGLGDPTRLVNLNFGSSLTDRLPSTISSSVGKEDESVNDERNGRSRFSLRIQSKHKTTAEKRQQFYKRISSRSLIRPPDSGADNRTSNLTASNLGNAPNGEREEPRGRRHLKRSESFRLGAIKELARNNSTLSDIYDESTYFRRGSSFSDGTVDVVKTRAVPRARPPSLTRQISLLSLRSNGSTMSLMSLDSVAMVGRGEGRAGRRKARGGHGASRAGFRTKRNTHQGESPSRVSGRLSRRSQLKSIAPPPSLLKCRFIKAVRLLQLITRSFKIFESRRYLKDQEAESVGLGAPLSPRNGTGIFFDVNHFKARKEGQLTCEAKRIMTKDPSERTPEEIHKTLVSLRNTMDAFVEFPVPMQQSIAKFGWYNKLEKRRVIIREGNRAENFYLMLSGTAVVTTSTRDEQSKEARVKLVNFLKRGNTFGERELMTGGKRPNTIVCHEEVELLSLDKGEYVTIFTPKNAQEVEKDVDIIGFLRTIKVFHDWPVAKLPLNNPKIFLLTYFRKGAVICLDSNKAEWIYVIRSGACHVLKELKEPKTTTPRKMKEIESPKKTKTTSQKMKRRKKLKLPPIIKVTDDKDLPSPSWARSVTPSFRDDASMSSLASDETGTQRGTKGGRFYNAAKKVFSTEVLLNKKMDAIGSLGDAEEHISLLDNLTARSRSPRLADLTTTLLASICSDAGSTRSGETERNSVFLKLRRCVSGEVFGLNSVLFKAVGGSPSLTLMSEGAECILISKSFFLQHLTETAKDRLLRTVHPWPAESRMQELLQEQADWDKYKSSMMGDIINFNQKIASGSI